MTITLKEITRENFIECVDLKVRDDQPYVASNVFSIAEAKVSPECIPMGVYAGESMVGFVMYIMNTQARELYIIRLMIDQRFQHQGYGRETLEAMRQIGLQDAGVDKLALSTSPENTYGIRVYETFGFKDTGVMDHGEEVFTLDLGK
jgi:diamine N-acetyltransferase